MMPGTIIIIAAFALFVFLFFTITNMKAKIVVTMFSTLSLLAIFFLNDSAKSKDFFPKSDQIYDVLNHLQKDYVDPDRINPNKMLKKSLEHLSQKFPPVVIKFKKKDNTETANIRVDKIEKTFTISDLKNLNDLNNKLQKIIAFIKSNLVEKDNLVSVDYAAINGFLATLDPHTSLLVPEIYTDFKEDTKGNYSGVGMYIGIRDEKLKVISPIPNSPAFRSGIEANDEILQINGEPSINISVQAASQKIKGEVGTKVNLLINRKEFSKPKTFTIVRDRINLSSVNALDLSTKNGRIGYIRITRFHQKTIDDLDKALKKVKYNYSDFKGFIVDLRNNPGGILQQAIKVSNKFLDEGVIVSTAGVKDKIEESYSADWYNSIPKLPLIILVNNGSASASEIVTAALKQNNRALVIGSKTFGKGSVQQLRQFKDGSALKLTISKYLTPNNSSLQSIGINPHIIANVWFISEDFVNILNEENIRSRKLSNNFNEWGNSNGEAEIALNYLFEEDATHSIFTIKGSKKDTAGFDLDRLNTDYLLYLAGKILSSSSKNETFKELKQTALDEIKIEKFSQTKKLIKRLNELGIKWDKNISGSDGVKIDFWVEKKIEDQEPCSTSGDKQIMAGSNIYICVTLNNTSNKETERLQAISNSSHPIFDKKQFVFGNLKAQQKKKWFVPISIPITFSEAEVPLEISLKNATGDKIKSQQFFFKIKEQEKPFISYVITAYNSVQKNKKFKVNDEIKIEVNLKNLSEESSDQINISLLNGEGKKVFLTKGKAKIETLANKQSEKVEFSFILKDKIPDNKINLSLKFNHNQFHNKNIEHKFFIPIDSDKPDIIKNSAPEIDVLNAPLISNKSDIELKFLVSDDHLVRDIHILQNGNKKFYQTFNKKKVNDKINLTLRNGLNTIQFNSRDNYNVSSKKQLYIFKQ